MAQALQITQLCALTLQCAARMTWRKMRPRVERLPGSYATKVRVPAEEMKAYNARLERSATLPKYDIT